MNNVALLIKTLFRQQFRIDKSNKRSKRTRIGIYVALGILIVIYLPLMAVMLVSFSKGCVENGFGQSYLSMVFTAIEVFALIFGTIMLVNTLFFSKDNAFLSTLPVKPSQIFFAKLATVALNELMIAGTIGYIAVIIYGIVAKLGVLYYILGLLAVIISPLLSLLVSSILLFPLMYIMSFIKKSTVLTSIVSIVMYVLFFVAYFIFISSITTNIENTLDPNSSLALITSLGNALFFNYALAGVVLINDIGKNLLIVLAVWGIGFVITYFLSNLVYRRGVTRQAETSSMKIAKQDYKQGDVLKSLIKRDWNEIKRDNTLFFYCVLQVIMAPLAIFLVVGVMYKDMEIDMKSTLSTIMGILFFIMFSCGANYVATSSITRENRKWYFIKTIPIPYTMQIRAKVRLAYIFTIITSVLSTVSLILTGVNTFVAILNLITVLVLGYGFVCWQVKLDIDKPRLNWATIAEGLKNNSASIVTMFASMGIGLLFGIVCGFAEKLPEVINISKMALYAIGYAVLLILSCVFALLKSKSLYNNTDKLIEKLEG